MRIPRLRMPVVVLLLAAATAAPGQVAPPSSSPDLDALDRYIEDAREAFDVPGLAVAIVKDGRVVLSRGYGVRELGRDAPVDDGTLFAIASNTKAFTAAAVGILVDEGKLGWDDPVREHLPWLELYAPYVSSDLRIRDLLTHRSGLGTFSGDLLWYGTELTPREVLRRARHLEQAAPFRAEYHYSNLMFLAAGEVVAEASGMPWERFVRERILAPLGMDRTLTDVDSLPARSNAATPHGRWEGELVTFPWYDSEGVGSAGALISSARGMASWLGLQLGRGEVDGRRIFSEDVSREMWAAHVPLRVSPSSRERFPSTHFRAYGLGWSTFDYRGRKVVGHGGALDGMYSRVAMVPEEDLGLVILTNSMTSLPVALAYRILDGYLGGTDRDWSALYLERQRASLEREAGRRRRVRTDTIDAPPSLPLEAYAGTYRDPLYGDAEVTLEEGTLVLRLEPAPEMVADLSSLHFDTFLLEWRRRWPWFGPGRARFTLDDRGRPARLELDVPNDDFWFQELDFRRVGR